MSLPEKKVDKMAKYEINFACGHTEIRDLFGKHIDLERKIEYFERNGVCSECWEKQKEAERQAEIEKAKKSAEEFEASNIMVELTGSEKQVAWAKSIRAEFLKKANKLKSAAINNTVIELIDVVISISSAKWWIENARDYHLKYWIRNVVLAGVNNPDEVDSVILKKIEELKVI